MVEQHLQHYYLPVNTMIAIIETLISKIDA